jgi:GNAT superfamily N-acetyltransferase
MGREDVRIREARPEEADLLTDLAYRSKRFWGYDEETLDDWAGPLTISPEFLEANPTWVAEDEEEGRILGFCALLFDGTEGRWELDHMWVDPDAIGTGVGGMLFLHACEAAENLGAKRLWILSDPGAEGFYLHMGAERIGDWPTVVGGEPRVLPVLEIRLQPDGAED